jgi:hypothetical protein
VPHYDAPAAPNFAAAPTFAAAPNFAAPPLVEPPVAPPATPAADNMRRRDFRPPVEQQPSHTLPPEPSSGGLIGGPIGGDAPLDYHTQMTVGMPGAGGHSGAAGGPVASAPIEQTLSRRELRELRDHADLPVFEPTRVSEPFGATAAPVGQPIAMPVPPHGAPPLQPPVSQQFLPPVPQAPAYQAPVYEAPPAPPAVPDASTSVSPSPSTGSHWSVGIHDDDDPFENTFSREVGSAVSLSNTNALVLPEMPTGGISGPVAGTGEIIITGMIDVPRMVSSTGAVPTVHESPDIDDLFDPGDLTAAPADAAPVSALKAVSSHTSARSIITTGKRSSSNAVTTVLVASTVVMAVVAIGLFVLAAVNGLF